VERGIMPTAYSYVRFSTPEQIKGDSLRRQTEFSEKYAAEHGLVLDSSLVLRDLGLSAYSGEHRSDRGALGQFLRLVEEGKIPEGSVLLVESLDRLSREEITEALKQFLGIIGKGIKIVTLTDNREYTNDTINANVGELIVSLTIMSRAHEESATKALRLAKAWEGKRAQISTRKLTARCPAWLQLSEDKRYFIVIEDRRKVIRRIFDMKLSGKGVKAIVRELNGIPDIWKLGSRDKRHESEGWRESYVTEILRSRAVIGEFQPRKLVKGQRKPIGDPIPDYFPPVIEKDVFYRVQEQIRENIGKGGRTGKVSNLFGHLAKCGYCGGSMAFVHKTSLPNGRQYLVCDRARRGLDCYRTFVRYGEFERLVLTYCKGLRPQDLIDAQDSSAIVLLKEELAGIVGELNSIKEELENLTDSIMTTSDKRVREMLEKRMAERLDVQGALRQREDDVKQQIDRLSSSFENTQATLDSLKKLFDVLSDEKTERLIEIRLRLRNELRKLIKKIDVFPEGFSRFTVQTAEKALEDISSLVPKGSEGYKLIKEELKQRVERPKDFRSFRITFASGSIRTIIPEREFQLAWELDREESVVRIWSTNLDGTMVCEEYSRGGFRKK
jgi:DNA invertase Pin-like site-specific DNA recombinase